jgi:hypothetical protein
LLLLLPIDGNNGTLIAKAAATIKLYLSILINNGTVDGNPILSHEPPVLHHFDPLYLMILKLRLEAWRLRRLVQNCKGIDFFIN